MKYHLNPCLIGRLPSLAPLGDALAAFFIDRFEEPTGGCPCCMAVRILALAAFAGLVGLGVGLAL